MSQVTSKDLRKNEYCNITISNVLAKDKYNLQF